MFLLSGEGALGQVLAEAWILSNRQDYCYSTYAFKCSSPPDFEVSDAGRTQHGRRDYWPVTACRSASKALWAGAWKSTCSSFLAMAMTCFLIIGIM